MRILNLYAGIGGNRKLWGDEHDVTAVENNEEIANIYKHFFPKDDVIISDAHEYLLNNFDKFDFIWSSPPCPTHSRVRKNLAWKGDFLQNKPKFPDMKLYEEIIFLMHYFKGNWVVENVISYYEPLIKPIKIGRHYFWSNLDLNDIKHKNKGIHMRTIKEMQEAKGFDISNFKIKHRKDTILRNCIDSELGKKILEMVI